MLIKKISILFILFVLITPQILNSQRNRIRFEKLTSAQGLSQSSVLSICQDYKGFLWFGTYDGVCRYDGYQFKYFKHNINDSTSLSQNSVRYIFEDREGILWISTEFGLNAFDYRTEKFKVYITNPKKPDNLTDNRTRRIFGASNGDLWICTDNGLTKLDSGRNIFTRYYHDPNNTNSISGNFIRVVFEDSLGNIWIGTDQGLDIIDNKTGDFIHYKHNPKDHNSISDNCITCIEKDNRGAIWIGTHYGGLNRLDPGSSRFIHYEYNPGDPHHVSNNYFSDLLVDQSGTLWGTTYGGGLVKYDRKNDRFINYQMNKFDPDGISSNLIHCIYEDRTGIIYLGTDFGGINKINTKKSQFLHYEFDPLNPRSLFNANVSCFYEDVKDGGRSIWIGTRGGGLAFFNRTKEEFFSYYHNPDAPNTMGNDDIRCITKDRKGFIWAGTSNGISRFDPVKKKFRQYFFNVNNKRGLAHYMVFGIYVDKEGILWIATNGGGLDRYNEAEDGFIHYQFDPQNPNSISDNYLWCILEDNSRRLWIGTNTGGLNCFDKTRQKFIHYKHEPKNLNSLSDNKVLCLCQDHEGILWIGTAGGGLNRFDPAKNKFSAYYENNGLSSNTIHAIVEDEQYNLWISTNKGLSKFDRRTESFRNFTVYDGLQDNEFHVNSAYKSLTGEIFFGGRNGFNIFNPKKLEENSSEPQIALTDFRLFNKSIPIGPGSDGRYLLKAAISETNRIDLSYKDEVISFEFAALDYSVPQQNMYAYIMEGFDRHWNFIGNRRYATYTKLNPGRYIFKVKGSNNNGIWNNAGTSLEIVIDPPFWETWWLRSMVILGVIGLLISGYKVRTSRIRAQNRKLQQKVQERTAQLEASNKALESFAFSVSHDLRTPLRTIEDYTTTLKNDYNHLFDEPGKAIFSVVSEQAKRLVVMIDELLEFSRVSYSSMNMSVIDMVKLAETVFKELTSEEARERITLHLGRLPEAYGDPILIRQVWLNLISNAIKYSSKKESAVIAIEGRQCENEIIYKVEDSGTGFDMQYAEKIFDVFKRLHKVQDFEGTGVGLAIVRNIVSRHGGRVWAEGEIGKGAKFYFSLPLTVS
ncbi:MAG: histidine kinase [Bacteroidetes bacterium]|nr:histidine kinase [Bacteroidota bacterium]